MRKSGCLFFLIGVFVIVLVVFTLIFSREADCFSCEQVVVSPPSVNEWKNLTPPTPEDSVSIMLNRIIGFMNDTLKGNEEAEIVKISREAKSNGQLAELYARMLATKPVEGSDKSVFDWLFSKQGEHRFYWKKSVTGRIRMMMNSEFYEDLEQPPSYATFLDEVSPISYLPPNQPGIMSFWMYWALTDTTFSMSQIQSVFEAFERQNPKPIEEGLKWTGWYWPIWDLDKDILSSNANAFIVEMLSETGWSCNCSIKDGSDGLGMVHEARTKWDVPEP